MTTIATFSAAIRAELSVYAQHNFVHGPRRRDDEQHSDRKHIPSAAIPYATAKTPTRTIGVATKVATDIKCVEWRHGAAKERPLKTSSLNTLSNPMNCVCIGGHGIEKTTVRDALI